MSHKPASALKTIPLVWPFAVWGLDMVGPLRTGRSGFTHVLVAVDKFTKWIEAKPIKNLDACTAISFVRGLTFRYGVPHSIITNNGSNFDSDEFRAFCASQGTRVDYASVVHPQSNGQAERANGLILKGLKPRLMRDLKHAAGAWVDELPSVLWGLRTTPNRSTGRTPLFLVYGAEAVLPSDLLHNAPTVELYNKDEAEQARQDAVDLLEEEREMAMIRSTIYQQDLRRFHAKNVKSRAFQEGDLVLRVDQQKPHKLPRPPEPPDGGVSPPLPDGGEAGGGRGGSSGSSSSSTTGWASLKMLMVYQRDAVRVARTAPPCSLCGSSMKIRRRSGIRSGLSVRSQTLKHDMSHREAVLSARPTTIPNPRSTQSTVLLVQAWASTPTRANGTRNGSVTPVAWAYRSQGRSDKEKLKTFGEGPPCRTILSRVLYLLQRTRKSSRWKA
ncbi:uncharacterized protein LOC125546772 [Triticum urartu]|uniref:uncharacterized protein LOC125546772 n=1 Tax=Triticum urartu TaxID=4572 RepID=UPI002042E6FA|nr:uncharacterized protein LOC125546772 [Triticum urartu]